jgi:hypothetical protein
MRRMERGSLGSPGESLQGRASGKEAEAGAAPPGSSRGGALAHRPSAGGRGALARRDLRDAPQVVAAPSHVPALREAFPSARQKRCAGLKRSYYPDYVREFIDYDYDDKLPEAARVFLAAFSEEYYRGWRLKRETQLHGLDASTSSRSRAAEAAGASRSPRLRSASRNRAGRAAGGSGCGAGAVRALDEDSEKLSELIERTPRVTPAAPLALVRRPRQPAHHAKQPVAGISDLGAHLGGQDDAAVRGGSRVVLAVAVNLER